MNDFNLFNNRIFYLNTNYKPITQVNMSIIYYQNESIIDFRLSLIFGNHSVEIRGIKCCRMQAMIRSAIQQF
jgi:hypothetical protein